MASRRRPRPRSRQKRRANANSIKNTVSTVEAPPTPSPDLPAPIPQDDIESQRALSKKEIKQVRLTRKKMKALGKLGGEFKRDLPDIYQLLDGGGTAKQIQKQFYMAALAAIVDLIPVLESKTGQTAWDRDVLALNAAIAQGVDLLKHLEKLEDAHQQAIDLNTQIIDPLYNTIAQQFVTCISLLRSNLESYTNQNSEMQMRQIIQVSSREFGAFLDISKASVEQKIIDYLA